MASSAMREPGLSAADVIARIEQIKEGGDTLLYTRRNVLETTLVHVGLTLLAVLLLGLLATRSAAPTVVWALVGGQLVVTLAAIALASRAARSGHTFEPTDTWDGALAAGQLALVVACTYATGGCSQPDVVRGGDRSRLPRERLGHQARGGHSGRAGAGGGRLLTCPRAVDRRCAPARGGRVSRDAGLVRARDGERPRAVRGRREAGLGARDPAGPGRRPLGAAAAGRGRRPQRGGSGSR